jgi:hypothetical protein
MNWRGVPLIDYQTIVDLIRNTRTQTGLSVQCQLDTNKYDLGVQITDEQMLQIKLRGDKFHKESRSPLYYIPAIYDVGFLFLAKAKICSISFPIS